MDLFSITKKNQNKTKRKLECDYLYDGEQRHLSSIEIDFALITLVETTAARYA